MKRYVLSAVLALALAAPLSPIALADEGGSYSRPQPANLPAVYDEGGSYSIPSTIPTVLEDDSGADVKVPPRRYDELLALASTVNMSDSLVGSSKECGVFIWAAQPDRAPGTVMVHARHTEGCFTYDYTNFVGSDPDEPREKEHAWQMKHCVEDGQQDVAAHFRYYRDLKIDPASVKVTCTDYN